MKIWYQSQHPNKTGSQGHAYTSGDVSDYSSSVAAKLKHFPLKELQCIPKAAVWEAGLSLWAPAPETAQQGMSDIAGYYKNEGSEKGISREPGIILDRYFLLHNWRSYD